MSEQVETRVEYRVVDLRVGILFHDLKMARAHQRPGCERIEQRTITIGPWVPLTQDAESVTVEEEG